MHLLCVRWIYLKTNSNIRIIVCYHFCGRCGVFFLSLSITHTHPKYIIFSHILIPPPPPPPSPPLFKNPAQPTYSPMGLFVSIDRVWSIGPRFFFSFSLIHVHTPQIYIFSRNLIWGEWVGGGYPPPYLFPPHLTFTFESQGHFSNFGQFYFLTVLYPPSHLY